MRSFFIFGYQGAGKTTLIENFMKAMGKDNWKQEAYGVRSNQCGGIFIMGKYSEGIERKGTDAMSYVFSDKFRGIWAMEELRKTSIFIAEGDRVINKNLNKIPNKTLILLSISEEEARTRTMTRTGNYNPKFFKGRVTKTEGIKLDFPHLTIENGEEVVMLRQFMNILGMV